MSEPEQPKHRASDFNTSTFPTWCPGCGDFGIWAALKNALVELGREPHDTVVVYGIGCSGNMANNVNTYAFHGLHGRPVPVAEGIKMANHGLTVIVIAGDGDGYGEGLGHFLHAVRGNADITYIVHNNQVYGLTTGQTSPTSDKGYKSKSTPHGVIEEPINPISLALGASGTFVARGYAGDIKHLTSLIVQGVQHKGFSLIDVFQPCVTFNKINTHLWFQKMTVKLEEMGHDPSNREAAIQQAFRRDQLPIGLYYKEDRPAYHEQLSQIAETPLVEHPLEPLTFDELQKEFM
ncbi:MAG: 2-oxoacid:ferredoxin oxidoreductase subunit beta [Candidatus Kerfeldbacteria bacterium]|nr:2-oxoacid:ferredoxin oxidoreductase subunit beta [Candidatus Kerfeldbacteria bacterium]